MLGNLLGHIDALLGTESNAQNDLLLKENNDAKKLNEMPVVATSAQNATLDEADTALLDTRKESIQERTISTQCTSESAYYDMSHELYKSIHSGISELDNDISINTEPSLLIESSNDGARVSFVQKDTDGNVFQKSNHHMDQDSVVHEDIDVFAATPTKLQEPFVIKSPFCDSERASFADMQDGLISLSKNGQIEEDIEEPLELFQAIHGLDIQDSDTIDDFRKLKNGKHD